MLSVVSADLPRIRMTSNTGLPILSSCSMIAMRQYVMMAICIWIRTAFSDSPQNRLTWRCLLDPFEEQFHLPSVFIKKCDFPRFEIEVVRVVDEASVQLRSIIDDTSDDTWILFLVRILGEADSLVLEHVVRPVKDALAIDNFVLRLAFLPDDEEGSEYMDSIESGKVKVASVKDIAGKRLVCEPVHRVDIMHPGIGDSVEDGDLRDDVNLSMDTDARLCTSELGPSEYCHAEVNGRRIDCVEPAVQLKIFRDALALSNRHHVEGKLLKDTMVSERIRFGQYLHVD